MDTDAATITLLKIGAASPVRSQTPVGDSIAAVRRQLGWSVDFAAAELGISARHLDQIEAGVRTASDELLNDVGRVYGVNVERLQHRAWVERNPAGFDVNPDDIWSGWLPTHFGELDNEGLFSSIAVAIRNRRLLNEDQPVYLRDGDFPVLAPLVDFADDQLPVQVMRHLRLTWIESCDLIKSLSPYQTGTPSEAP